MDNGLSDIEKEKRSLKRYRKNIACIKRLENKLFALENHMTSIKSPSLTGMPKGGAPITLADQMADKIELEERIERLKAKGKILRKETLSEIDRLEDPQGVEVMELYFLDGESLEQIAEELNYTERHVYRIYSRSLSFLASDVNSMS